MPSWANILKRIEAGEIEKAPPHVSALNLYAGKLTVLEPGRIRDQAQGAERRSEHQKAPHEHRQRTPPDQAEALSDRPADRESLHRPLLNPQPKLARIAPPR